MLNAASAVTQSLYRSLAKHSIHCCPTLWENPRSCTEPSKNEWRNWRRNKISSSLFATNVSLSCSNENCIFYCSFPAGIKNIAIMKIRTMPAHPVLRCELSFCSKLIIAKVIPLNMSNANMTSYSLMRK